MKFWLNRYIYLLPLFLLGGDILSLFINLSKAPTGEGIGYSIAVNILFFDRFYYGKFCWFTRLTPFAMTALNIVNIIGFYCPHDFYRFWYVITIFCVLLTLTLILEIDKRLKA